MRDRGPRRYRMTEEGEVPVWASSRRLREVGRDWARHCWRWGRLATVGNVTHDEAVCREWARLGGRS